MTHQSHAVASCVLLALVTSYTYAGDAPSQHLVWNEIVADIYGPPGHDSQDLTGPSNHAMYANVSLTNEAGHSGTYAVGVQTQYSIFGNITSEDIDSFDFGGSNSTADLMTMGGWVDFQIDTSAVFEFGVESGLDNPWAGVQYMSLALKPVDGGVIQTWTIDSHDARVSIDAGEYRLISLLELNTYGDHGDYFNFGGTLFYNTVPGGSGLAILGAWGVGARRRRRA